MQLQVISHGYFFVFGGYLIAFDELKTEMRYIQ